MEVGHEDRSGQAKILTPEEIQLLFTQGLDKTRDRALFGICLYTACRIREACTLRTADVYDRKGLPRNELIIRKENTKGKLSTRTLPVIEELRSLLISYYPQPRTWFLFTGRHGKGHIHPDSAARILKVACDKLDLEGVSTHSFRRTALTQMSNRVMGNIDRDIGESPTYKIVIDRSLAYSCNVSAPEKPTTSYPHPLPLSISHIGFIFLNCLILRNCESDLGN